MKKGILLIAHFFIFSVCSIRVNFRLIISWTKDLQVCVAENVPEKKDNPDMEILIDNISDLASKVLEIFGEKRKSFFT